MNSFNYIIKKFQIKMNYVILQIMLRKNSNQQTFKKIRF